LLKIFFIENYTPAIQLNKKESQYLKFTLKVWRKINQLIKKSCNYKEFKELFNYDIKQIINGMEYSRIINQNPYLINKTEYWLYAPHTMQFVMGSIIDIMHFSEFDMKELSMVREISWQAQKMARIGNCISTWEREIKDNDLTSGVFAYAINSGILSCKDLIDANNVEIIQKIKKAKIRNKLLKEWENCYLKISKLRKKIKIIDVKKFLLNLEKLIIMEMISEKFK